MKYYNDGFRSKKNSVYNTNVNYDLKTEYRYPFGKYSPAYRLKKKQCELCGTKGVSVIMHQVRKLSNIKPNTPWNSLMIKNNRKTLSTCENCYNLI